MMSMVGHPKIELVYHDSLDECKGSAWPAVFNGAFDSPSLVTFLERLPFLRV